MPVPKLVFVPSTGPLPEDADGIVLVTANYTADQADFAAAIKGALETDATAAGTVGVYRSTGAPAHRLVYSPTGPLNRDFDDVRRVADACTKGITRAKAAGARKPILHISKTVDAGPAYERALEVGLLAALAALYAPLSVREFSGEAVAEPIGTVYFTTSLPRGEDAAGMHSVAHIVVALEEGRRVAKDIGGSDPERMGNPRAAEYVQAALAGTDVAVTVISDPAVIEKEYPCAAAVGRGSLTVPRHTPRIVRCEYVGAGPITQQVYLIGKGVTFDTGGIDLKVEGAMVGMSRDKCGAATAAGIMRVLALLKPAGIKVVSLLGFFRNDIGPESYTCDEIITSRAGKRVLVVNTDAEGRMVMVDLLAKAKEEITAIPAASRPPTFVHTIATLTGHAVLTVGLGYSISVDSGAAARAGVGASLRAAGEVWGDPLELSTLRREDFAFVAPSVSTYDVKQCNSAPSSKTPRGHQFPAAFLIIAGGLEGADLAYSHLDIAGGSVAPPYADGVTTGQPLVALAARYVLPHVA